MKLKFLFAILIVGLFSFLLGKQKPAFIIEIPNEGHFDVFEIRNHEGQLIGYESNISAPVCEDKVCYDVHVTFKWDILGDFERLETNPSDPLTKLDHIPFSPSDYEKLQSILTNHDLIFTGMPAEKLVVKTKTDGLDAYSGATVAAIKNEVIEGALFTCYTLWHIANGNVVDSIQNHTSRLLDTHLIALLLKENTEKANYFIINKLTDVQFEQNLTSILTLIKNSSGYFPKNAFEKLPPSVFKRTDFQKFITQNYADFSYHTRLAVLNGFDEIRSIDLAELLIFSLTERNSSENQRIINLIIKSKEKAIIRLLLKQIELKSLKLNPEQRAILEIKDF